jgi:signal transduction histidine kinase
VAAYYVVAEALTNMAKHAGASVVQVDVDVDDGPVRLAIRDDGVGGADPSRGSGLVGLKDRVEATGGILRVKKSSRAGHLCPGGASGRRRPAPRPELTARPKGVVAVNAPP